MQAIDELIKTYNSLQEIPDLKTALASLQKLHCGSYLRLNAFVFMKSSYPSGKCVYNEYFYEKQTQKNDVIKQHAETIAKQNNNSSCAACVEIQS